MVNGHSQILCHLTMLAKRFCWARCLIWWEGEKSQFSSWKKACCVKIMAGSTTDLNSSQKRIEKEDSLILVWMYPEWTREKRRSLENSSIRTEDDEKVTFFSLSCFCIFLVDTCSEPTKFASSQKGFVWILRKKQFSNLPSKWLTTLHFNKESKRLFSYILKESPTKVGRYKRFWMQAGCY